MNSTSITLIGAMLLAACQPSTEVTTSNDDSKAAGAAQAHLANPASVYCVSIGGAVEITQTADGQVGLCHLENGEIIEEWKLYKQERNKLDDGA